MAKEFFSEKMQKEIVAIQMAALSEEYGNFINPSVVKRHLFSAFKPQKDKTLEAKAMEWEVIEEVAGKISIKYPQRGKIMPTKIQNSLEVYCTRRDGEGKLFFTDQDALELYMDSKALDNLPQYGQGTRDAIGEYLKMQKIIAKDFEI